MAKRSSRKKKHGFGTWSIWKKLGVILGGTVAVVASTGVVLVASKMTKIETTELDTDKLNIAETEEEIETGYVNVALFGLDSRQDDLGKGNRSDTMMIASLNKETKEVRMVSIYRDTLLQLDDGSYNKANSAYSFGGPEGAISLINRNMDMNIEKYVAVNFNALVDVIDALGGLDVSMTYEEVVHMNNYCVETSKVTGKGYEKIEPTNPGTYQTYHLNGVQAVSYSRIRYTEGGDFVRAARQRTILMMIAEKAQTMSLSTVNKIIDSVFPQVSTNFTLAEMIGYAKDFQKYTIGESMGFPENNTTDMLNVVGSVVIPSTLSSNVADVHRFLFGNDGYQVSSKISQIEGGIAAKAADRSTGTVSDDDDVYYRQDYDLGDDDYDYDDDSGSYGNDDDGGGDDTEDGSGGGIEGDAGGDGESYPDEGVE
ncbi:MAG: LCP family protein [Dorea sp.]|nr:LCP family protein [Dorea sp.]